MPSASSSPSGAALGGCAASSSRSSLVFRSTGRSFIASSHVLQLHRESLGTLSDPLHSLFGPSAFHSIVQPVDLGLQPPFHAHDVAPRTMGYEVAALKYVSIVKRAEAVLRCT